MLSKLVNHAKQFGFFSFFGVHCHRELLHDKDHHWDGYSTIWTSNSYLPRSSIRSFLSLSGQFHNCVCKIQVKWTKIRWQTFLSCRTNSSRVAPLSVIYSMNCNLKETTLQFSSMRWLPHTQDGLSEKAFYVRSITFIPIDHQTEDEMNEKTITFVAEEGEEVKLFPNKNYKFAKKITN